jgi:hypothetical protein
VKLNVFVILTDNATLSPSPHGKSCNWLRYNGSIAWVVMSVAVIALIRSNYETSQSIDRIRGKETVEAI